MVHTPLVSVITLMNSVDMYGRSRESLAEQYPPGQIEWLPIEADARSLSAAQGLNEGIERAQGRWIICAHQDVLFPEGWWARAHNQLSNWSGPLGVAGLVGVTRQGQFRGHVLDPHGHCRWLPAPSRVMSIDEHVIILPAATPLRFDESNPGFHCYGTDIAMSAAQLGLDVVALDAPVVHLSGGKMDETFVPCRDWLVRKWASRCGGVIPTCCGPFVSGGVRSLPRWLRVKLAMRTSIRMRSAPAGSMIGLRGVYARRLMAEAAA